MEDIVMEGVNEYKEELEVSIGQNEEKGRIVIKASNEGGFNGTEVDLEQLLIWIKNNKPELLSVLGGENGM